MRANHKSFPGQRMTQVLGHGRRRRQQADSGVLPPEGVPEFIQDESGFSGADGTEDQPHCLEGSAFRGRFPAVAISGTEKTRSGMPAASSRTRRPTEEEPWVVADGAILAFAGNAPAI